MKRMIATALAVFSVVASASCTKKEQAPENSSNSSTTSQGTTAPAAATKGEKVTIENDVPGTGAEAVAGKTVSVHYTGTLKDGKKFDSSRDRGQPFKFQLGAGQVIQGWEQGIAGMKVGGKRKLIIPSSLGYGERGAGSVIPPNSELVFDVELLGVE